MSTEMDAPDGEAEELRAETGEETARQKDAAPEPETPPVLPVEPDRLQAIVESLLFAADRPLTLTELKRLLGERDGKRITTALEALTTRRRASGIEVMPLAGGWTLRTNPEHAPWVGKLLQGRPIRLSRAMMEALAIVAYRQPVTRPEIDDIRGVDCGPVLKTLLDRGLIRIIGKKEEVGRPLLYGTTPEFLRTFSLRALTELPTLREFHELAAEDRARVEAEVEAEAESEALPPKASPAPNPGLAGAFSPREPLPPDPGEDGDALLDELERAAEKAARAVGTVRGGPDAPSS